MIILILISGFVGCMDKSLENLNTNDNQKNNNSSINNENEPVNNSNEKPKPSNFSNTMLKSIEVMETDKNLELIFTGHEDELTTFMNDFKVDYFPDYYELRFSNLNTSLQTGETLVCSNNVSDITGSRFIKRWFKSPSNIDHAEVYSILFRFPIEYTVEKYDNPGRIIVKVEKKEDTGRELVIVRSPSSTLAKTWSHLMVTTRILDYLDLSIHFRILVDEDGYFFPIATFENESDAELLKQKMLAQYKEHEEEISAYYNSPYELIVEKQSDL